MVQRSDDAAQGERAVSAQPRPHGDRREAHGGTKGEEQGRGVGRRIEPAAEVLYPVEAEQLIDEEATDLQDDQHDEHPSGAERQEETPFDGRLEADVDRMRRDP